MSSKTHESARWQLEGTTARLVSPHLQATVQLDRPLPGLSNLEWDGTAIEGSILGVTTGEKSLLQVDLADAFARSDDLVATYGELEQGPYSLQVYWTVTADANNPTTIDATISLQTPLLESFPKVSTESRLPTVENWLVPLQGSPTELSQTTDSQHQGQAPAILSRIADSNWSYFEMTHPEDQGSWKVVFPEPGRCLVRRELGGAFLEKGVIRRLRVRGIFLPRENDVDTAKHSLTEFSASAPPLTT